MKNAMKKLMSLVLVAMILVSALPFAASADGTTTPLTLVVRDGVNPDVSTTVDATINTNVAITDCLAVAGVAAADVISTDPAADFVITGPTTVIITKIAPPPVVANLKVYLGDTEVYSTTGTPEGGVSVADCLPYTGISSADVEAVYVNGVAFSGSSFNLGVAGSTTTIKFIEKAPITVAYLNILVDGVKKYDTAGTPGNAQSVAECLIVVGLKAENVASILVDDTNGNTQNTTVDGTITMGAVGSTTNVRITTKPVENNNTQDNNTQNNTQNNTTVTGSTSYSKLSGDVILEICMDKNQTPTKSPSIKSSIALDGKVTLDEVKSVVKQYFNSIDTDTGIVYDGLYVKQTYAGNVVEWVNDDKVSTVEGLYDAANNSKLVTIRVYISNAKLASSGNADPTNPKTGDTIMMPVAVMTVSACALAVAFYLNKKRAF